MAWYYAVNDERIGPVAVDELCRLLDGEVITEDTLVWTRGMPRWEPVRIALKGVYTARNDSVPRRFNRKRTWHYAQGTGRFGPIPGAQMDVLYHEGTITNGTYVWTKGMAQWQRLGELIPVPVAGAPSASLPSTLRSAVDAHVSETDKVGDEEPDDPDVSDEAPPIEACARCGRLYTSEDMVAYRDQWVCVACKNEFFQREREGFDQRALLPFAGFWIRSFARLIDILIVNVMLYGFVIIAINLLVSVSAPYLSNPTMAEILVIILAAVLAVTIPMSYETFFVGRYGATPGKMVVHIQVVRSDGSEITYGRALVRFFTGLLSQIFLFLGCLSAALDRERRAVHDYICDTRVVLK